mgnify:CR=1 FL=1
MVLGEDELLGLGMDHHFESSVDSHAHAWVQTLCSNARGSNKEAWDGVVLIRGSGVNVVNGICNQAFARSRGTRDDDNILSKDGVHRCPLLWRKCFMIFGFILCDIGINCDLL